MANITMKELLEAGVHFGHQTKRWNPKMKEYIFGERNGIYIIDLQKTLKMFKEASKFVQDLAADGRIILFVGTKRQAQDAIAEEAQRCSMFYVNQRWLGGLLTNWITVQKSVKRLKELDEMATDGRYDLLPKKEVIKLERERKHLQANLAGIKNMTRLPDAIFVIDSNKEQIAVRESRKLGIPVVAVRSGCLHRRSRNRSPKAFMPGTTSRWRTFRRWQSPNPWSRHRRRTSRLSKWWPKAQLRFLRDQKAQRPTVKRSAWKTCWARARVSVPRQPRKTSTSYRPRRAGSRKMQVSRFQGCKVSRLQP